MIESIVIDPRFRGPPRSGNGGYVAGLLGRYYRQAAVVTLRKPPPLDVELTLAGHGTGHLRLLNDDELIAESEPAQLELETPDPPDFDAAERASRTYIGFDDHHFGGCFVCGPDRAEGDGLRIFAGALPGGHLVAAPWIPGRTLVGDTGRVKPEFLWAALDCPGYFALHMQRPPSVMLLGRFEACVEPIVRADEKYVVIGWPLGEEGRKRYAGTALFSAAGELVGSARATWLMIDRRLW